MKIHFCDLCNESVPQADLDQGRAFLRKGRVVCATCDRLMSHDEEHAPSALGATSAARSEPGKPLADARAEARAASAPEGARGSEHAPEPRSNRRSTSGAGWLAALTLLFGVAAVALLVERDAELERDLGSLDSGLARVEKRSSARAEEAAGALDARVRAGEQALDARLAEERARIDAVLARLEERLEGSEERRAGELAALEDVRRELASLRQEQGERLAGLSARVERGEQDVAFQGKRLTDLELAQLVRNAPLAAPQPSAPSWQQKVPELESPVAGTRYEAVDALGRSGDPAVVPHLVPLLKDQDTFVRMATARVLGTLGSREAVEPLFDALEDGEAAVREAAWVSLLALTGRDFRYDPLGVEAERQKRAKAWSEWWRKEGSREGVAGEVAGARG